MNITDKTLTKTKITGIAFFAGHNYFVESVEFVRC